MSHEFWEQKFRQAPLGSASCISVLSFRNHALSSGSRQPAETGHVIAGKEPRVQQESQFTWVGDKEGLEEVSIVIYPEGLWWLSRVKPRRDEDNTDFSMLYSLKCICSTHFSREDLYDLSPLNCGLGAHILKLKALPQMNA